MSESIRIISGGQTGVDRAALDTAMELGIDCGGWCPAGRRAEDGPIPARYPLQETETDDPAERTRRNVRDAGATLIIASAPLTGGTLLTEQIAGESGRPLLVVDPVDPAAAERIRAWLGTLSSTKINIAGPRESESPGIGERTKRLLRDVLSDTIK